MRIKRFEGKILIRIIVIISIFLLCFGCQKEVGAVPKAPDFSLPDLSGKTVTLEQYRGSVVVLDFWATWCPPCRASIPELVKLQDKYKDDGLVVLGISTDDQRKVNNAYLRSFCDKFKINYRVLRYDYKVIEAYFGNQAPALPTMYVIDREGHVRDKLVGFTLEDLQKSLNKLFK